MRATARPSKDFLLHIHYFRAFAILSVILVHIWQIPVQYDTLKGAHFVASFRELAFHGSTIYFIFISGFLFYYLSPHYSITKYYKSKLLNVIAPYICFSCTVLFVRHFIYGHSYDISSAVFILLKGKAQQPYWYIPFISVVFLVSPFLLKIPRHIFTPIALILGIIPIFGTRTGVDISIGQYAYYFPTYLLGMLAAMHREKFEIIIENNVVLLVIVSLATTMLMINNSVFANIDKINTYESLHYIHKISIIPIAIHLFKKIAGRRIKIFHMIATYSFSLYFMHPLMSSISIESYYNIVRPHSDQFLVFASTIYCFLISILCLTACYIMKKLTGTRSRIFIGA